MTDKESLVKIIAKNGVYNGKSLSFDYYVIQPEELADALIKAGFGDVKAWKRRVEKAEQDVTEWKNHAKALCKRLREFVERLYKQTHNYYPSIDHYCLSKRVILVKDLEELAVQYGVEVQNED